MKTRAAVALEKGKPLTVTDVELDGPKASEVLVEIKATGICHTDEFTLSGADPEGCSHRFWATRAQVLSSMLGQV
jgi:S-(hydroxymethyl)glutathione dehydrogenase / alcohol dehydrogenase